MFDGIWSMKASKALRSSSLEHTRRHCPNQTVYVRIVTNSK